MKEVHARHLAHVGLLLRLLDVQRSRGEAFGSVASSPELFLVRDEGEFFWELVGLRLRGFGSVFLGALRFQRQPDRFQRHARRTLDHYLSAPPKELGVSRTPRPAGLLELILPDPSEEIPAFQRRAASGELGRSVFLDSDLIEFAFDFRSGNPSVERDQVFALANREVHVFRTLRGHVLTGISPGLHVKLHQGTRFVAVQDAVQHTAHGRHVLPSLVFHRSQLALDVPLGETGGEDPIALLSRNVLLMPAGAEPRHLLVPDLG